MSSNRVLVIGLAILTALLLQTTVFARLTFLRGRPNIVLVVVICFALADGPGVGTVVGFVAGLLLDLTGDHTLGVLALILCVVGYAAGLIRAYFDRLATLTPMLVVAGLAAATTLLYAGIGALLSDPRITQPALLQAVVLGSLYDGVLTPFVFPAVSALSRRTDPADRRW